MSATTGERTPSGSDGQATGAATPRRRRLPILPVLVLLAIVGGFVLLFLVRSQPSEQVARLIDSQVKLAAGGRYDQLWEDTLSPELKAACPFDAYVGALQQITTQQPDYWSLVQYRDLHIDVEGDRAVVTYVITYNGAPVERATPEKPDLYVRATETVYGPTLSVEEQLAALDRLRDQAIVVGKEYDEEKADIQRHGPIRRVDSLKGQWYDDVDSHVRCG
jgi:hypothetical protein